METVRHSPWSTFAPVVRQHNKTMPFSTTEKGSSTGSGYLPSGIFSASRFHWSTCAAHTLNLGYKLLLTVRRFGALNQCIESDVIRVKSGKTIPRQYYARSNRPAIHRLR